MNISTTFDTRYNVAFIGKAGSGKTTAAEYLRTEHGYLRASFAQLLKDIAVLLWGESALTDREKLQRLGVAVRDIQEDTWVSALTRVFDALDEKSPRIALDDCRFPNEYWALKERNWLLIRIESEEATRIDRLQRNGKLQDISQLDHISETAIDDLKAEYTIENNGYVEQMYSQIESILNTVAGHV